MLSNVANTNLGQAVNSAVGTNAEQTTVLGLLNTHSSFARSIPVAVIPLPNANQLTGSPQATAAASTASSSSTISHAIHITATTPDSDLNITLQLGHSAQGSMTNGDVKSLYLANLNLEGKPPILSLLERQSQITTVNLPSSERPQLYASILSAYADQPASPPLKIPVSIQQVIGDQVTLLTNGTSTSPLNVVFRNQATNLQTLLDHPPLVLQMTPGRQHTVQLTLSSLQQVNNVSVTAHLPIDNANVRKIAEQLLSKPGITLLQTPTTIAQQGIQPLPDTLSQRLPFQKAGENTQGVIVETVQHVRLQGNNLLVGNGQTSAIANLKLTAPLVQISGTDVVSQPVTDTLGKMENSLKVLAFSNSAKLSVPQIDAQQWVAQSTPNTTHFSASNNSSGSADNRLFNVRSDSPIPLAAIKLIEQLTAKLTEKLHALVALLAHTKTLSGSAKGMEPLSSQVVKNNITSVTNSISSGDSSSRSDSISRSDSMLNAINTLSKNSPVGENNNAANASAVKLLTEIAALITTVKRQLPANTTAQEQAFEQIRNLLQQTLNDKQNNPKAITEVIQRVLDSITLMQSDGRSNHANLINKHVLAMQRLQASSRGDNPQHAAAAVAQTSTKTNDISTSDAKLASLAVATSSESASPQLPNNEKRDSNQSIDVAKLASLLGSGVLPVNTISLTSPQTNNNFISGLITLVQLALVNRLVKDKPELGKKVDHKDSIISKILQQSTASGMTAGDTRTPSRMVGDLFSDERRESLLQALKTMLTNHAQQKLSNTEQKLQGNDVIYLTLPPTGPDKKLPELRVKRDQAEDNEEASKNPKLANWQLELKLPVGTMGEIYASVDLRGNHVSMQLITTSPQLLDKVSSTLTMLTTRLTELGLEVAKTRVRLGEVPASLSGKKPLNIIETQA